MNNKYDNKDLDIVFGKNSIGNTPEERAKTSKVLFVRGQNELSLYKEECTGLIMTAEEALNAFGFDVLYEVYDYGSAILVAEQGEPAKSLINRRKDLKLTIEDIAIKTGLTIEEIKDAENADTTTPIYVLHKITDVLDLDIKTLSFIPYKKMNELKPIKFSDSVEQYQKKIMNDLFKATMIIDKDILLGYTNKKNIFKCFGEYSL